VTNNHVIEDADQIKVRLANEQEFDASLVGRDPNTDLALIKIKPSESLTPLNLGDSDVLKVGSWVVAIGSPFGLEQTVTAGIVSAKGRIIGSGPYDDFIQTDASINPGNSGGPLINMQGEVVGINTAIVAQGQGIGFAIPVNLARGIIAQLKSGGEVTRGWLGVAIQDLNPDLAQYYGVKDAQGVLVTEVYPGDPADKAGMRPKDIITAVDGKEVSSGRALSRMIAEMSVGQKVALEILRDGAPQKLSVNLGKRPDTLAAVRPGGSEGQEALGLRVAELTPEVAGQFGFDENEKGVVVAAVNPGSKADEAGVQPGDLVKEVNRTPVADVKEFQAQVGRVKSGDAVQLLLKRGNAGFIVAKITK
jgi:serine protease Do